MFRFRPVKPAGVDLFAEFFGGKRYHLFGGIEFLEQFGGNFVYPFVRALRGEYHRDQKFVFAFEF